MTTQQDMVVDRLRKYQVIWRRLFAQIIDSLILVLVVLIVEAIYEAILPAADELAVALFANFVSFFVVTGYYVYMHASYGQTLGKWIFKVRVVDCYSEAAINWYQAIKRESIEIIFRALVLVFTYRISLYGEQTDPQALGDLLTNEDTLIFGIFSLISYLFLGLQLGCLLSHYKHRLVHDFIASTVVISTDKRWQEMDDSVVETASPVVVWKKSRIVLTVVLIFVLPIVLTLLVAAILYPILYDAVTAK